MRVLTLQTNLTTEVLYFTKYVSDCLPDGIVITVPVIF